MIFIQHASLSLKVIQRKIFGCVQKFEKRSSTIIVNKKEIKHNNYVTI